MTDSAKSDQPTGDQRGFDAATYVSNRVYEGRRPLSAVDSARLRAAYFRPMTAQEPAKAGCGQ